MRTACVCLLAVACRERPIDWSPTPRSPALDDPTVARVNEVTIHASQVKAQAQRSKKSLRESLNELITFELLAQEARRLGYADSVEARAEVAEVQRRIAVQRFLEMTFERQFTRTSISEEVLRDAYEREKHLYQHAELRECVHALVPVKGSASSAENASRRALAVRIRDAARKGANDAASFAQIAAAVDPEVKVEELPAMPAEALDRPFADALFKLPIATVSDIVRSSYGWHVIWLKRIEPPRNVSFRSAREKLIERVWPEQQAKTFEQFLQRLERQHRIERNERLLVEETS